MSPGTFDPGCAPGEFSAHIWNDTWKGWEECPLGAELNVAKCGITGHKLSMLISVLGTREPWVNDQLCVCILRLEDTHFGPSVKEGVELSTDYHLVMH